MAQAAEDPDARGEAWALPFARLAFLVAVTFVGGCASLLGADFDRSGEVVDVDGGGDSATGAFDGPGAADDGSPDSGDGGTQHDAAQADAPADASVCASGATRCAN